MATKQETSSDRKSSSAVSGQSSAPQRWIPVWMSLVGLVVGAWLTYSGSSAVFHRYQAVSDTQLTQTTNREVESSVVAVGL